MDTLEIPAFKVYVNCLSELHLDGGRGVANESWKIFPFAIHKFVDLVERLIAVFGLLNRI